ncbi:MAG: class I SAM-dependent methyltransferase [Patescibacteria group bacterium]|jgi:ubiquinone/menaquinone biosynthesis C-methylase UbiE|nr:class I SAM-dependent methyltransferase [Patescibacteria group bacterium]
MHKDTQQRFDINLSEIVPEYESKNPLVRWLFNKRLSIALNLLSDIDARTIADIGCGDGSLLRLINSSDLNVDELWGVDLNPGILALKRDMPNAQFAIDNLFNMRFDSNRFDAVTCLDTLEHMQNISKAVQELKRILKNNAYLITSEPVESALYRSLRFVLKGTYSQESGPSAGAHYHNAREVDQALTKVGFIRERLVRVPLHTPFDLFWIARYLIH